MLLRRLHHFTLVLGQNGRPSIIIQLHHHEQLREILGSGQQRHRHRRGLERWLVWDDFSIMSDLWELIDSGFYAADTSGPPEEVYDCTLVLLKPKKQHVVFANAAQPR